LRILNLALQILLLFLFLLVFNSFADESIKKVTDELDKNFLFKGKPIHPGCIKEFEVGLADSPPPIIKSIDIESCMSSNDFYMDLKKMIWVISAMNQRMNMTIIYISDISISAKHQPEFML